MVAAARHDKYADLVSKLSWKQLQLLSQGDFITAYSKLREISKNYLHMKETDMEHAYGSKKDPFDGCKYGNLAQAVYMSDGELFEMTDSSQNNEVAVGLHSSSLRVATEFGRPFRTGGTPIGSFLPALHGNTNEFTTVSHASSMVSSSLHWAACTSNSSLSSVALM